MEVRIGAETVRLEKLLGEGGEARVYKLDRGRVAKIYRLPTDPEFEQDRPQLVASRLRVIVAQRKLALFPRDLPPEVVAPQELIHEMTSNLVIGYTMPMVQGAKPLSEFKSRASRNHEVTDKKVLTLFRNLRATVDTLHDRGIVIGDFNDTNVLVKGERASIIDADSMQYGPFRSKVFMAAFVDPNRCDPRAPALELTQLHNEASDWYAWWTMLFQSLCFIHPYGGVYKPTDKAKQVPQGLRGLPQHRISVFHPEVKYPAQARPLDELPGPLKDAFRRVFVEGQRPTPTDALFDQLGFNADGSFDRTVVAPPTIQAVATTKRVHVNLLRETGGELLASAVFDEKLVLLHQDGEFLCRDNEKVLPLKRHPETTYHLSPSQTAAALGATALIHSPEWPKPVKATPQKGARSLRPPICGSVAGTVLYDGAFKLFLGRKEPLVQALDIDADLEPVDLWANGNLLFVLTERRGALGYLVHHLAWDRTIFQSGYAYGSTEPLRSAFGTANEQLSWLFLTYGARSSCDVLDAKGKIVSHLEADASDLSQAWMHHPNGACQNQRHLFLPGPSGIDRLSLDQGKLSLTAFGSNQSLELCDLHVGSHGLFAVDRAARKSHTLTVI